MRQIVVGMWISCFFLICAGAAVLNAATIQVPNDQPTIPAAFAAAVNGDTVLVAPGTYSINLNFAGKGVRIASSHGPDLTFLSQANVAQPLLTFNTHESDNAQVVGFTIANAYGPTVISVTGRRNSSA